MIAVFLSILFPGLGQIYYGKTGRGLLMIVLTFIPFVYPFVLIWSIYDCIQLRKKHKVDPMTRKEAIIALVLGFIIIPLIGIGFLIGSLRLSSYIADNYTNKNKTVKEMKEIRVRLEKYRQKNNVYPNNLGDIIGKSPIRQTYYKDHWGNAYRYNKTSDSIFELKSAGQDGTFDTEDDLVVDN